MERDDCDDSDGADAVEREYVSARADGAGISRTSCCLPRVPLRDPAFLPNRVGPNLDPTAPATQPSLREEPTALGGQLTQEARTAREIGWTVRAARVMVTPDGRP